MGSGIRRSPFPSTMRKEYRYYVALLVLFFAYLAWTLLSSDSRPGCLIKAVTGLPCPGCGSSRALELLLHGCLWQSLCTNPLGLLLLLAAITSSFWERIDIFLMQHREDFPPERIPDIRQKLENMSDEKCYVIQSKIKDRTTMLLFSIFLGGWGVDRFMLGDIGLGVLKLLTGGCCGILWLIDLINCKKMTQDYNYGLFIDMY